MERITSIERAKEIMAENFIGPKELNEILGFIPLNLNGLSNIPDIPYKSEFLKKYAISHILILGIPFNTSNKPLTLNNLREKFGIDPIISEPCFYNQDWYLNEIFFNTCTIELKWYLIKKNVDEKLAGVIPTSTSISKNYLPSALLVAYVFFCWYFHTNGKILWENEYVWCNDLDNNLDRVYVGRYRDLSGKNKNGFSVHRHLKLTKQYSYIDVQ